MSPNAEVVTQPMNGLQQRLAQLSIENQTARAQCRRERESAGLLRLQFRSVLEKLHAERRLRALGD